MSENNESFINALMDFHGLSIKLKNVLRSQKTSQNRTESTAEHSWQLALMVMLVSSHLDKNINVEKALKMAIVHDLGECKIGDMNLLDLLKDKSLARKKHGEEEGFFLEVIDLLNDPIGAEILGLWKEFETNDSYEAKVVNALDKLEAQLQQNEYGASNLEAFRKSGKMEYLTSFFSFDSFIAMLANRAIKTADQKTTATLVKESDFGH